MGTSLITLEYDGPIATITNNRPDKHNAANDEMDMGLWEILEELVPVVEVTDVTHVPTVERDLALIRVKCAPAERAELSNLADIFRGRIVDVSADSVILEVTGDVDKVDGLVELLKPRGIVEMVRTGKIALVRGNAATNGASQGPALAHTA